MIVKAWNNSEHHPSGSGYGIKLSANDRDLFFLREWKTILLELDGESNPVEVNIDKKSFWNNTCRELINKRIGQWLITNHLSDWPKYSPPILELYQIEGRKFRLTKPG